ncbi:MAG: nucleotidyltransferase domain-containing protein [Calditrichaeota bacterium]|nr:MAG: nucleotidyltransferase domain-containing protein [Calditrichota bacterium]
MLKQQIINEVKNIILSHCKPERIYLYGSQVNGEAHKGSDIDIAYDAPGFTGSWKIWLDMIEQRNLCLSVTGGNIFYLFFFCSILFL